MWFMEWLLIFVAGFLAAGVDGALGMGFGPTSSAILLSMGFSPASTSAVVNVAKTGAGVAGAVAHWKFDNVDRRLTAAIAVPGVGGALIGVLVLASVDGDWLRPALAALLCGVGFRMLRRFGASAGTARADQQVDAADLRTAGVGALGGCTNGLIGAWGPVVTPYLMHRGVPVHIAVGSVNTAEVAVAVVAVGALFGTGTGSIDPGLVIPMLAGGVAAAPIAAHLVRRIPQRAAGIAVASLLLVSQVRELSRAAGIGSWQWLAYGAVAVIVALSARPRRRHDPAGAEDRRVALPSAGAPT